MEWHQTPVCGLFDTIPLQPLSQARPPHQPPVLQLPIRCTHKIFLFCPPLQTPFPNILSGYPLVCLFKNVRSSVLELILSINVRVMSSFMFCVDPR
jgi:hypothetical protein